MCSKISDCLPLSLRSTHKIDPSLQSSAIFLLDRFPSLGSSLLWELPFLLKTDVVGLFGCWFDFEVGVGLQANQVNTIITYYLIFYTLEMLSQIWHPPQ